MANRERGEVELVIDGTPYTLKLTTNAAATLQGRHRKPLGQMLQEADALDVVVIRGLLWALLQKHHTAQATTEERVGDLIDDAGGLRRVVDAIADVLSLNSDPNAPAPTTTTADGGESATRSSRLVGSA